METRSKYSRGVAALGCLAIFCLACEAGPRSGRGLRLPEGDVARGELAFNELGCVRCHDIEGEESRAELDGWERSERIVTIGGPVTRVESYGELVTSIVNPSHEIVRRYPRDEVADGDSSKMEYLNDRMSVSQLLDLIAYLQAKYEVRHEPLYIP